MALLYSSGFCTDRCALAFSLLCGGKSILVWISSPLIKDQSLCCAATTIPQSQNKTKSSCCIAPSMYITSLKKASLLKSSNLLTPPHLTWHWFHHPLGCGSCSTHAVLMLRSMMKTPRILCAMLKVGLLSATFFLDCTLELQKIVPVSSTFCSRESGVPEQLT